MIQIESAREKLQRLRGGDFPIWRDVQWNQKGERRVELHQVAQNAFYFKVSKVTRLGSQQPLQQVAKSMWGHFKSRIQRFLIVLKRNKNNMTNDPKCFWEGVITFEDEIRYPSEGYLKIKKEWTTGKPMVRFVYREDKEIDQITATGQKPQYAWRYISENHQKWMQNRREQLRKEQLKRARRENRTTDEQVVQVLTRSQSSKQP